MLDLTTPATGNFRRNLAVLGAAAIGALLLAQPAKAGSVFMILMENHNLTQPGSVTNPQQILGNAAAPYMNSLITPGNSNSVQVSYALNYHNAGNNVHPSEPNYVWAQAGSDFGAHTDADPLGANGNTFYDQFPTLTSQLTANGSTLVFWHQNFTPHLTGLLDAGGVSWKNYQEDVQLSASPTNSASGANGPTNIFNGTTQFNYAVKHNPAGFFVDSALANVFPLDQLFVDLQKNRVGRFNWITPDQFNDAHSALAGGFTYKGMHFTGDQAAIAQGDNFLSIVIPEIMASKAYKDNGAIIIWWDETEGGDTAQFTLPEFVISPLAKGNAFASTAELSHSSDIKTLSEIFGLPLVNNPIPPGETNVDGGFNWVATVNDLSDLFVTGAIPAAPTFSVTVEKTQTDSHTLQVTQTVRVTNTGMTAAPGPLFLVLDNLTPSVTLINPDGNTSILPPLGSPFVSIPVGDNDGDRSDALHPGQSRKVTLQFNDPGSASVFYNTRVLNVTPAP